MPTERHPTRHGDPPLGGAPPERIPRSIPGAPPMVPLAPYKPSGEPADLARDFYAAMRQRRSVRFFSDRPVPLAVIEWIVSAAGTAPSGANKQPWRFVCVRDQALKKEIRAGAEAEEREFYARRASQRWLADLWPLGTDENKEFLEVAPWLIAVFKLVKVDPDPAAPSREPGQTYYTDESVGIACGMLITAIHLAGLVTLTHTPSPMRFFGHILGRPAHERPFLLLPVGYPAPGCVVPDIHRKPLEQIMVVDKGIGLVGRVGRESGPKTGDA